MTQRLVATVIALAAALAGAAPAGAQQGDRTFLFGFSDGSSVFPYDGSASAEQIAGLEAAAGAEAGRLTVRWEEIQPAEPPAVGPPKLDWSAVDELVDAQQAVGVAPLPMLLGAPGWAREEGCSGVCPPSPDHFRDWSYFVASAAHRYRGAAALEIWNEPNLKAYWAPDPDPAAYAALFDAAAESADRVAPRLPLITGGLAYVEEQGIAEGNAAVDEYIEGFLRSSETAFKLGVGRVGIGLHVYPSPGGGDPDGRVAGALSGMREGLLAAQPSVPVPPEIWITEFGASTTAPDATTGAPVTPERQAELILETLDVFESEPDVAAALVYTLVDRPPATGEALGEEGFGVVTRGPEFTPKPAYCALAERNGRPLPEGCPAA